MKTTKGLTDEWEILKRFLPEGWEGKAKELKAVLRLRKIESAESILRVLLIHLADGKSLRTTSAYAKEAQLCDINDVALLHRLKSSKEWLRWMAQEILKKIQGKEAENKLTRFYKIRVVDGTVITEPGSTGTDWRIHYSFQLNDLKCDEFMITGPKTGEGFNRYKVSPGELIMGDRGYCRAPGITHVLQNGGQVITRFHSTSLPLFTKRGKRLDVLNKIKTLEEGMVGDWDVWFKDAAVKELKKGRLCVIKKSKEAIEKSRKTMLSDASRKQKTLRLETLEYGEYIIIFTTLNRRRCKVNDILQLYRGRWQIEIMFKRLKGIIKIGHLPKYNPESCKAWLYGKMLVALLTERIYKEAEFFSPWGYPI